VSERLILLGRAPAGQAIHCKPFAEKATGLSVAILHAAVGSNNNSFLSGMVPPRPIIAFLPSRKMQLQKLSPQRASFRRTGF